MDSNRLIVILLFLLGIGALIEAGVLAALHIEGPKDLLVIAGSSLTAIAAIANSHGRNNDNRPPGTP